MRSLRMWVWLVPFTLYGVFWLWYTPLSGPMTQAEIDDAVASLEQRGAEPETIERLRTFFEADDGRSFIMVNILDQVDDPVEMPATGPGASASDLMGHYMEYMWPALFSRACHPVFAGQSVGATMDVVGIEGAERWESAAMMRYRSRRDMWEISSDPRFGDRHDYKVAALEKTIALPVLPLEARAGRVWRHGRRGQRALEALFDACNIRPILDAKLSREFGWKDNRENWL
ncbi:MAG: hypothetical protein AAFO88_03110 [Pseudomonadota bacterium]